MKFYGHGIVWDSENDKALCTFVDGELETTDTRVIKILKERKFKSEKETKATPKGEQ